MPASSGRLPHPHFTRWDYTPVTASPPSVVITSEPNYLEATFDDDPDPPVLRCLSDEPERDVTAVFGKFGDSYTPTPLTVTRSVGEDFIWENIPEGAIVKRVPAAAGEVTKVLRNLTVQDAGLYSFEVKNANDAVKYFGRLVVR
ncbi:uncharacterized protein LOC125178381, partial [Hyalella azteca]|uniref:Uncharacterized protein LOC125178381 n=1 Tax=Hyalella azteca TaxID=294128 RepID=A0A979FLL7_HYAAZ